MAGAAMLSGQTQGALDPRVEVFATLPSAAPTENIGEAPDGSIYVTGIDDHVVWKISPQGQVEKFSDIPSVAAVLGVAPSDRAIVVTAFQRPFRRPAPTAGAAAAAPAAQQIDFTDVGTEVLTLDRSGKVTGTITGEKGHAFNGITAAGNGKFLIADSNFAAIWQVEPGTRTLELWMKDDVLAPNEQVRVGANGVKVHDGWAYVSVSSRSAIYRVKIGSTGHAIGGLTLFAKTPRPDDFDIAKDGTIYLSSGTSIYKVSPAGDVTKWLDNVPGGPATLISRDDRWLYWPTRGGTAPQRVLRTAIH
jgi:sugar lactone lactonase YvrE